MVLTAGAQKMLLNTVCMDKRLHTRDIKGTKYGLTDRQLHRILSEGCLIKQVCIQRHNSTPDLLCVLGLLFETSTREDTDIISP